MQVTTAFIFTLIGALFVESPLDLHMSGQTVFSLVWLGLLGTCLFVMYSLGQFVNGQLGDKFGARKLVFVGMIGSALLNIIFSFSTAFGFMMVVWGLNGYFQSMG